VLFPQVYFSFNNAAITKRFFKNRVVLRAFCWDAAKPEQVLNN